MIKWEYKVVPIKTQVHSNYFEADRKPTIDDVQNDLNELGEEGWEPAGVQNISLQDGRGFTIAYLKKTKGLGIFPARALKADHSTQKPSIG